MARLTGTGTALVTPFKANGTIDERALRGLVEWQIKNKIEFLVPCGSTGESATMTRDERRRVIEIVVDQNKGRVPVIAGTGTNSTLDSLDLTHDAKEVGADAVLLVGPYYNKPTQEGFYRHFKRIVEECDVKAVLYNVPGRTASNMLPETTLRLAEEVENVIAIKEASNNLEQIMQIIKYRPKNFAVLSGEDTLTLPIITAGGDGVISVVSNEVPKDYSDMTRAALKGDLNKAKALHYKLFELMKANFYESNPIPVKTALHMMGRIDDSLRLPLTKMSKPNREKLKKVLKDLKLI
ncbi:MAG TPA: 4-hydroxy-tetrahydrodipicolinate synthase [Ignavibacteria bacterium]|nr:4-hydroxy-tetrahydrodipicolinate synthase [Bacteroidota bacterium]HRE12502.1 4-hydroxy-tetrahydrodipicolinate synthase [Ignavibacteria bacterium]HRF65866.1 4-hydroxy-tetrahydrodipicolinate synthase [Ignavibacteria bacterium]HRJ04512.1 4-hydroxy-tetrahydrodipicolinate synthase [Ignavibacteria bacterium]